MQASEQQKQRCVAFIAEELNDHPVQQVGRDGDFSVHMDSR